MNKVISIEANDSYAHFLIDGKYLGMLVFEKGELSDFRAIIRKNKLSLNAKNIGKMLELCVYELLNQFLYEAEFLDVSDIQQSKIQIVSSNSDILGQAEQKILESRVFRI